MSKETKLVYSTETGRVKSESVSASSSSKTVDGKVRIRRETKGRKGSGVSLIEGLQLPADALKKLAKELKSKCGVGGTIKNGVIEIQTDNRELLKELLQKKNISAVIAGG